MSFSAFRKSILDDADDWSARNAEPSGPTRAQVRATLGRRNRFSTVAKGHHMDAPLHAKKVTPMQLQRLLDQMRPQFARRIATLFKGLAEARTDDAPISPRFQASTLDVKKMKAAGCIEHYKGGAYTPVRYFSVHEAAKNRRRPIMWPWLFLLTSDYQSEFSLANVHNYCQSVNDGQYSCAFDLASSFWQVLLPDECHFVMQDVNGHKWRITRLPFGVDSASEIMQIIVEELGHIACKRAGLEGKVHLYTHIDNIMCSGDHINVVAWQKAFVQVCSSFGVTLNDEPENNAVSHRTEFAGIELNFLQKRVRPRVSFVEKLPTTAGEALRTFTDLESCVGKLMYGMAILQMRCHQFHAFFAWWRRCLSQLSRGSLDWESFPFIQARERAQLATMLEQVKRRELVKVLPPPVMTADDLPPDERLADVVPVLVVDATLYGYGGVLYERGRVIAAFGDSFPTKAASMGLAEISAALGMLQYFASRLAGRRFVLLTDNTSCESGVRKGASSHLDMDRAAFAIHALLRDMGASVVVGHVDTKDNVADAVSRAKELDILAIEASRKAANEVVALLGDTRVGGSVKRVVEAALG